MDHNAAQTGGNELIYSSGSRCVTLRIDGQRRSGGLCRRRGDSEEVGFSAPISASDLNNERAENREGDISARWDFGPRFPRTAFRTSEVQHKGSALRDKITGTDELKCIEIRINLVTSRHQGQLWLLSRLWFP